LYHLKFIYFLKYEVSDHTIFFLGSCFRPKAQRVQDQPNATTSSACKFSKKKSCACQKKKTSRGAAGHGARPGQPQPTDKPPSPRLHPAISVMLRCSDAAGGSGDSGESSTGHLLNPERPAAGSAIRLLPSNLALLVLQSSPEAFWIRSGRLQVQQSASFPLISRC
jgi:hypothetical protein